jgi:RimJ/RimL family protein N-acetyltransferase
MNDTYLTTARVRLRQYRPEDFERLVELNSDPEVMRFLGGARASLADTQGGVERTILYREKFGGRLGVFTAELLETGEYMGWFLLRPDKFKLEDTRNLELGYRLHKKFWGKGYATEVSRALIRKAFEELEAESVWAKTLIGNLASRRVMEKVGLTFEEEFIDAEVPKLGPAVRYRLLRSDWRPGT